MAVEDKQGISRLEQVVEEIADAERAKELKKEHKRLKKKKRKENKCKFANENKDTVCESVVEEACNGKENDNGNIDKDVGKSSGDRKEGCLEEKPACDKVNDVVNGVHGSSDDSSCASESNHASENNHNSENNHSSENNHNKENNHSSENSRNSENSHSSERKVVDKCDCTPNAPTTINKGTNKTKQPNKKDNCKCGDDKAKTKLLKKNGFITPPPEEKPPVKGYQEGSKKQKGVQSNGYITPPLCSSCGQLLSPRGKFERGTDRGRESSQYLDKCAKCASLNSDVANKRSRKKYGRQKEVTKYLFFTSESF